MADPLVTVIVLAAQREHLLSNSLNSVKAQSYPNVQIIVTGSNEQSIRRITDDMQGIEVLADTSATDTRLLNRAYEQAKGNYLAVLETGNLWYPDFLAVQVDILQKGKADLTIVNGLEETIRPDPVVLFQVRRSYRRLLSQTFDTWYHPADSELRPMLTGEQLPPISGFVFRKSLLNKGWDEAFIHYNHQAALASLLKNHTPVVAICRSRLWFRRLDPLTHLQPMENTIRDGEQRIMEAKKMLRYKALSKMQLELLKENISLQYRLLALSSRKAGQQVASLYYTLNAICYKPGLLKILAIKSKTYLLRRI